MKLQELKEGAIPLRALPISFDNGDEFMNFVYHTWPSRKTHVERQGGRAWSADIDGDERIKGANFDEETGHVSWLNSSYEELT